MSDDVRSPFSMLRTAMCSLAGRMLACPIQLDIQREPRLATSRLCPVLSLLYLILALDLGDTRCALLCMELPMRSWPPPWYCPVRTCSRDSFNGFNSSHAVIARLLLLIYEMLRDEKLYSFSWCISCVTHAWTCRTAPMYPCRDSVGSQDWRGSCRPWPWVWGGGHHGARSNTALLVATGAACQR